MDANPEDWLTANQWSITENRDDELGQTLTVPVGSIPLEEPEDNDADRVNPELYLADELPEGAIGGRTSPLDSNIPKLKGDDGIIEEGLDVQSTVCDQEKAVPIAVNLSDSIEQENDPDELGELIIDTSTEEMHDEKSEDTSDMALVIADVCSLPQYPPLVPIHEADVTPSDPPTVADVNEMSAAEPLHLEPNQNTDNAETNGEVRSPEPSKEPCLNILNYENDTYSCAKCRFTTEDRLAFQIHIEKHSFTVLFKCLYCTVLSEETYSLIEHINAAHPDKDSYYTCMCSPPAEKVLRTLEDNVIKPPKLSDTVSCSENTAKEGCTPTGMSPCDAIVLDVNESGASNTEPCSREASNPTYQTGSPVPQETESSSTLTSLSDQSQPPPALNADDSQSYQTRLECFYKGGYYICKTCKGGSSKEDLFAKHVFMHLHGNGPVLEGNCPICHSVDIQAAKQDPTKCPLVKNMMDLLQRQKVALENGPTITCPVPLTSFSANNAKVVPSKQADTAQAKRQPLPSNVQLVLQSPVTSAQTKLVPHDGQVTPATTAQITSPLYLVQVPPGAPGTSPLLVLPQGHVLSAVAPKKGIFTPAVSVGDSDVQRSASVADSGTSTRTGLAVSTTVPTSGRLTTNVMAAGVPGLTSSSAGQASRSSLSSATQSASANLFAQKKRLGDKFLPSNTIVIEPIDTIDVEDKETTSPSDGSKPTGVDNTTPAVVPGTARVDPDGTTVNSPTELSRQEVPPSGSFSDNRCSRLIKTKRDRPGILSFKYKPSDPNIASTSVDGDQANSRTPTPTPISLSTDQSGDTLSSDGHDEVPKKKTPKPSSEKQGKILNTKTQASGSKVPAGGKRVLSSVVKCSYQDGNFVCDSCDFTADGERPKIFRRHLWKEVHPQKTCTHCPADILYNRFLHCPIINQLMKHLEDTKEKIKLQKIKKYIIIYPPKPAAVVPPSSGDNSKAEGVNSNNGQKEDVQDPLPRENEPIQTEEVGDLSGEATQPNQESSPSDSETQALSSEAESQEMELPQDSLGEKAPESPIDEDSDSHNTDSNSNPPASSGNNFQDVIAMIKDLNENNAQEQPVVEEDKPSQDGDKPEDENNYEGECENMFVISNVIGQATEDSPEPTTDETTDTTLDVANQHSQAQPVEIVPDETESLEPAENEPEDVQPEAAEDEDEDNDPLEAASPGSDLPEVGGPASIGGDPVEVDETEMINESDLKAVGKRASSQTCRREVPFIWDKDSRKNRPPLNFHGEDSPYIDSNKVYVCSFYRCSGWNSSDPVGFKIHNLLHHSNSSCHACPFCQRSFANEDNVISHVKEQHSGPRLVFNFRKFHCGFPECWYVSERAGDFKEHNLCHHAVELEYPCCFCQRKMVTLNDLTQHISDNVVYSCPLCKFKSRGDKVTKAHLEGIHPDTCGDLTSQLYICCYPEDVPQKPRYVERLINLSNCEDTTAKFKCSACDFVARDKSVYDQHVESCKKAKVPHKEQDENHIIDLNTTDSEERCPETRSRRKSKQTQRDWDNMEFYATQTTGEPMEGSARTNIVDLTDALQSVLTKTATKEVKQTPLVEAQKKTVFQSLGKGNEVNCEKCSFVTAFRVVKAIHERAHSYSQDRTRQLWCPHCPYATDTLLHFKIHLQCHKEKTRIRLYHCSYCPLVSNQMDLVEDHHEEAHPDSEFKSEVTRVVLEELDCPHCPEILKTELEILEHLETSHDNPQVQKYLKDMYAIASLQIVGKDKVMETVAGSTPPQLSAKEAPVASKETTTEEEDLQSGSDRFQCPYCSYSSRKCMTWIRHMKKHVGMGTQEVVLYCCKTCKYKSTSKRKVLDHCKQRHTEIIIEIQNVEINGSDDQAETAIEDDEEETVPSPTETPETSNVFTEICRYHCDFCEFSTNERSILEGHWTAHEGQTAVGTWGDVAKDTDVASPAVTTAYSEEDIDEDDRTNDIENNLQVPEHEMINTMLESLRGDEKRSAKQMISCLLCPYQTDIKKLMKRHIEVHQKQLKITDGYRCGYCAFTATTEGFVTKHMHRHHPDLPVKKTVLGKAKLKDADQLLDDNNSMSWTPSSVMQTASKSSESVPSLPQALNETSEEAKIDVPEDMIFKTLEKCPKCKYTTKVRYNFLRHLKTHDPKGPQASEDNAQGAGNTEEDFQFPRVANVWSESVGQPGGGVAGSSKTPSMAGSWSTQDGLLHDEETAEQGLNKERDASAAVHRQEADKRDMTPESMSQCQSEVDIESSSDEEDPDHPRTEAVKQAEQALYSIRVAGKDLFRCTHCVFMHKYLAKIRRHFVDRHDQYCPFQCGHCYYKSVETTKVRQHCLRNHSGLPVRILSRTGKEEEYGPVVIYDKDDEGKAPRLHQGESLITPGVENLDTCEDTYEEWISRYVNPGINGMHTCKLCGYQQDGTSAIKRHVLTVHLRHYPYRCQYCAYCAVDPNKILRHLKKLHPNKETKIVRRRYTGDLPDIPGEATFVLHDPGQSSDGVDLESATSKEGASTSYLSQLLGEASGESSRQATPLPTSTTGQADGRAGVIAFGGVRVKQEPGTPTELPQDSQNDFSDTSASCFAMPDRNVSTPDGTSGVTVKTEPGTGSGPKETKGKRKSATQKPHVKLYKCELCQYTSKWNVADVKLHILSVHLRIHPYSCRLCRFGCPRRTKLIEHCTIYHPDKHWKVDDFKEEVESAILIQNCGEVQRIGLSDRAQHVIDTYQPNVKLRSPRKPGSRSGGRPTTSRPNAGRKVPIIPIPKKSSPSKSRVKNTGQNPRQSSSSTRPVGQGHLDQPLDLSVKGPSKMVARKSTQGYPRTTLKIPTVPKPYPGPSSQSAGEDSTLDVSLDSLDALKDYTLWKCKSCGRGYVQKIKAQYHFALKHLNLKPYMCNYCSFGDLTRKRVVDHMVKEHAGQEVVVFAAFREHALVQKKVLPVKVDISEYGNALKGVKFIAPESDPKKQAKLKSAVRCPVCATIFDTMEQLDEHIGAVHSNYTGFKCCFCGIYIKAKQKMKYHLSHRHPDQEFQYQPIKNGVPFGSPLNTFEDAVRRKTPLSVIKKPNLSGGGSLTVALPFKRPKQYPYKSLAFSSLNKRRPGTPAEPTLTMKIPKGPAEQDIPGKVVGRSPPRMIKPRSDVVGGTVWLNCCHCSYTTLTSTLMRHHIMSHLAYRPFRCPYCKFGGVRSYQVKKHIQSIHPGKSDVHKYVPIQHIEDTIKDHFTMKIRKGAGDTDSHVKPYRLKRVASNESTEDASRFEGQDTEPGPYQEPLPKKIKLEQEDPPPEYEEETLPESNTQTDRSLLLKGSLLQKKEVFVCVLCGFRRPSRSSLLRHIMWELNYRPWCCPYCTYRDVTLFGVKRHCFQQHPTDPFKMVLKQNPDRMSRIHSLVEQSKIENGGPDVGTDRMHKDIQPRLDNDEEEDMIEGDISGDPILESAGRLEEKQANAQAQASSNQTEMAPIYEAGMMVAVPMDSTVVTSAEQLKEEETKQSTDPPLQCPNCSFTGYNKSTFRKHVLRHGPKRFMCGICNRQAFFKFDLIKHHARVHKKRALKVISLLTDAEGPARKKGGNSKRAAPKKKKKTNVLNKKRPTFTIQPPESQKGDEQSSADNPKNSNTAKRRDFVQCSLPPELKESGKSAKLPEGAVAIIDGIVLGPEHLVILDTGIFACQTCDFTSPHRENAKFHVSRHFPMRWKCPYCPNRNRLSYELRRHIRKNHPEKPIRVIRQNPNIMGNSPLTNTSPRKVSQGKQTPSKSASAKKPKPGPLSRKPSLIPSVFCCFYCSFKTQSTPELVEHQKTHASRKDEKADMETSPSKSTVMTAAAAAALKSDQGSSPETPKVAFPLKCGYCSFSTYDKNEFNLHRQGHMVIKPYKCGYCDYTGFVRSKVRMHCENIHKDRPALVIEQRQPHCSTPIKNKVTEDSTQSPYMAQPLGRWPGPNKDVSVVLEDVLQMSQQRLERLMFAHGVTRVIW